MSNDREASQIRIHAQNLLRSGTFGSAITVTSGRIETPIAVQTPEGRLHSWFVPVIVGTQLNGFFQFFPDGTFIRFSSFQRRPDKLTGCPIATEWLDPNRIEACAHVQKQPDETSGKPFLTYDRTPDRLVWAVPLTNTSGEVRLIYVVGETAYVPPPKGTYD